MEESKKIETPHKEKKVTSLLHLNPMIKEDRILAMITGYTDCPYSCPYYKTNCTLKLPYNKKRNCQGRSFIEGFLCPSLINPIMNSKPTKSYK